MKYCSLISCGKPRVPSKSELQKIQPGQAGLTTLAGFEKVGAWKLDADVEIINNLILLDFSALSHYFHCRGNGTTALTGDLVIGTVATHPIRLQPLQRGCSLRTLSQMCHYIYDSTRCPQGTEYLRTKDNTLQIIENSDHAPSPSPSAESFPGPAAGLSGLPILPADLP